MSSEHATQMKVTNKSEWHQNEGHLIGEISSINCIDFVLAKMKSVVDNSKLTICV